MQSATGPARESDCLRVSAHPGRGAGFQARLPSSPLCYVGPRVELGPDTQLWNLWGFLGDRGMFVLMRGLWVGAE